MHLAYPALLSLVRFSDITAVAQEKREGITISLDGVRADIFLGGQVLAEESCQSCGKVGWFHLCAPLGMTWPAN